jgi:hypothetical protein
MPEATLKVIAQQAGVAPVTVSRVVNGSENVAAATREKVLAIIRELDYTPNAHAANLRRKKQEGTRDTNDPLVAANEDWKCGCNSCRNLPCPRAGACLLSAEEGRALAHQLIRLRRDLDRLRKHTERVQRFLDIMQEARLRRLSSCAAH